MKNVRIKSRLFLIFPCFTVLITLFISTSCVDQIVENDLSFEERLVVNSIVESGIQINVYVGKTIPLNSSFNPLESFIYDAQVFIKNNDVTDTLVYLDNGIYSSMMIGRNGESYDLIVEWHEKKVAGFTTVPFSTTFQNARIIREVTGIDSSYYIRGILAPREGAVYGATWVIINSASQLNIEDDVIHEIFRESDKNLQDQIIIRTRNIPIEYYNEYPNDIYIRIHAFDEEYYNFFITQDANNATNNIFSQSGVNLRWNISGDGIGMFIGKTDFLIKVPPIQ